MSGNPEFALTKAPSMWRTLNETLAWHNWIQGQKILHASKKAVIQEILAKL